VSHIWSPKQAEFYTLGWHTKIAVADGPGRSGKTVAAVRKTNAKMAMTRTGFNYAFIGPTQKHLDNVLLDETEKWARDCNIKLKQRRNYIEVPSDLGGHNKLLTFVATDASAVERLKGYTIADYLIDEVTALPKDIVQMAMTRLDVPYAAATLMTNPKHRTHWFKTDWIDKIEDGTFGNGGIVARRWKFQLLPECDNPVLDVDEYVALQEQALTGAMKQQMLYGEWTDDGGLIFPLFATLAIADSDYEPGPITRYMLSCDPAEHSYTAAQLWGVNNKGDFILVDDWGHNHREDGALEYKEQAKQIREWVGPRYPSIIVSDWDSVFRDYLSAAFDGAVIRPAQKQDKDTCIQIVNKMINSHKLKVLPQNRDTIAESGGYIYDERARLRGEGKVQKKNDHFMDCMQYACAEYQMMRAYNANTNNYNW